MMMLCWRPSDRSPLFHDVLLFLFVSSHTSFYCFSIGRCPSSPYQVITKLQLFWDSVFKWDIAPIPISKSLTCEMGTYITFPVSNPFQSNIWDENTLYISKQYLKWGYIIFPPFKVHNCFLGRWCPYTLASIIMII